MLLERIGERRWCTENTGGSKFYQVIQDHPHTSLGTSEGFTDVSHIY